MWVKLVIAPFQCQQQLKSYLPPPEPTIEVERRNEPSSNVVPIGRIGDGAAGDEDDHGHSHGDDPLGWLRESIPGQNIFQA